MRMRLEKVCLPWKPFPCLAQAQKTSPVSKLHCNVIIMSPFPIMNTAVNFSRAQLPTSGKNLTEENILKLKH